MSNKPTTRAKTTKMSFPELKQFKAPLGTRTWCPIPHYDFADVVRRTVDRNDVAITREEYVVSKGGGKLFGVLDLQSPSYHISPESGLISLSLGIRNSVDRSFAATIFGGERVWVCDNLAFSAILGELRRHTRFIGRDLQAAVDTAIARCGVHIDQIAKKVSRLRAAPCNDMMAHDMMLRAANVGACRWRDVPKVLRAWRLPREEFEARNAWSLYNCFTEAAKGWFESSPQQAVNGSLKLNAMLAEVN